MPPNCKKWLKICLRTQLARPDPRGYEPSPCALITNYKQVIVPLSSEMPVWYMPPRGSAGLYRPILMLSIDGMFKGTRNTPAKVPDARSRAKSTNLDSGRYFAQRRHDRAPLNRGALVRVCQREARDGRAAPGLREWAPDGMSGG